MQNIVAVALAVSAILGACYAIGKAGTWAWRVMRQLARLADALLGAPPGPGDKSGRPGVLEQLAAIHDAIQDQHKMIQDQGSQIAELQERLAYVEAQMKPNGGSSLRDVVERIASPVAESV